MDERLKAIKDEYGLEASDMWQLPQNKQWLIKHAALEVVAAKAGIVFDMPEVIERDSAAGIAVICVTGKWNERVEWSFGEASPKNSKTGYPWAIAEKRAKDRVILKLIGIHGLVYSEDEMPDNDALRHVDAEPAPKVLVKDQRVIWGELRDEIDACTTVDQLAALWVSKAFQGDMKKLKDSWQTLLVEHKDGHKADLMGGPVRQRVEPDFSGLEARQ
jgi:hypothetical protein